MSALRQLAALRSWTGAAARAVSRRAGSTGAGDAVVGGNYKPSKFDRWVLVFTKTYPTADAVPEMIPSGQMRRAKDYFRIRTNIWMGVITLLGCAFMILVGRRERAMGASIAEIENGRK